MKRVVVRERKQFEEVTHAYVKCVKRNGNERLAFWGSYSHQIKSPKKGSSEWYREMVLLCTVFAITGSSTMILVRPAVSKGLGLSGSLREGPWTYRICSIVIMTPVYCTMLVAVGTVFGRHSYFRHFAIKMISRFGIPPEMIDSSYHTTHRTFRKW